MSEMTMSNLRAQAMREANLRGYTPTRDAEYVDRNPLATGLSCYSRVILFSYRFGGILDYTTSSIWRVVRVWFIETVLKTVEGANNVLRGFESHTLFHSPIV